MFLSILNIDSALCRLVFECLAIKCEVQIVNSAIIHVNAINACRKVFHYIKFFPDICISVGVTTTDRHMECAPVCSFWYIFKIVTFYDKWLFDVAIDFF